MSINQWVGVGRIARDLELKYTQTGTAVCKFTLAVNRQVKKEGAPDADFIQVVAFNKQAENLANYMSKGSQIGVVGSINTGSYEKDGQRIYTFDVIAHNIQFLESKKDTQPNQQPQQQYQQPTQQQQYQQAPPGYTQQQNFGHQAPSYGQTPQQGQVNYQTSQPPIVNASDLPF